MQIKKKTVKNFKFVDLLKDLKFFNIFVLIGFFSILLELITFNFFEFFNINLKLADLFALIVGIFFAFYFNIRVNFAVPKIYLRRSLVYFFIISLFSFSIQKVLKNYIIILEIKDLKIFFLIIFIQF